MQIHTKQRLAKTSINKRLSNIQNMFNFREKMRHRKLKKKRRKKTQQAFADALNPQQETIDYIRDIKENTYHFEVLGLKSHNDK